MGLRMEVKIKEVKDDVVRQQDLVAYFTHCNLQKVHLRLALLNVMGVCYKGGNFNTAINFARRLLESDPLLTMQQRPNKFFRCVRDSCRMPIN